MSELVQLRHDCLPVLIDLLSAEVSFNLLIPSWAEAEENAVPDCHDQGNDRHHGEKEEEKVLCQARDVGDEVHVPWSSRA